MPQPSARLAALGGAIVCLLAAGAALLAQGCAEQRVEPRARDATPVLEASRDLVALREIVVDPSGTDARANGGSSAEPAAESAAEAVSARSDALRVATIAEAAQLVARFRADGGRGPMRIVLAPGSHAVPRGVRFGPDAGPLEIVGLRGRRHDSDAATLVGAIEVEAPEWCAPDEAVLARIPQESRGFVRMLALPPASVRAFAAEIAGPAHTGHGVAVDAVHSEVFLGDRAMVPARWPNEGLADIAEIVDRGSAPREAEPDMPAAERRVEAPRAGRFVPQDRARVARWSGEPDAWAQGFWNWDWSDEQLPIAAVDARLGVVTLGMPHRYGLAQRGRFFVTNALAELDAPGECWIDRGNARVYAWIPSGCERARVSVSMLGEPMIAIDGARDVALAGLRFERTRGGAVVARAVDGVSVRDCGFRNIGACALDLDGLRVRVEACDLEEIGGRGVRLKGGDRATLAPSESRIVDSRFLGCGRVLRTYNPAVDLEGVGHLVARNEIARHPHIALFMRGNDHRIESNDIHDVVLETGDAGALYCGRDWTSHGNIVRGNMFSSIRGTDARFQNAVYLDDMASGFLVESNLFVDCNWGILAGGGRDNALRGNIFACCGKAVSYDARGVGWMAPHIADPATSTLHRNLAAVPVEREPWRTRFPTLGSYLSDRFGRPAGSSVSGNALIATPLGRIDDRACVRVEDNEPAAVPDDAARTVAAELAARARIEEVCVGARCLGPVGPRGRRAPGEP